MVSTSSPRPTCGQLPPKANRVGLSRERSNRKVDATHRLSIDNCRQRKLAHGEVEIAGVRADQRRSAREGLDPVDLALWGGNREGQLLKLESLGLFDAQWNGHGSLEFNFDTRDRARLQLHLL